MDLIKELNKETLAKETAKVEIGDTVRVMECRPLSQQKRWRLVEIVEKAK